MPEKTEPTQVVSTFRTQREAEVFRYLLQQLEERRCGTKSIAVAISRMLDKAIIRVRKSQ